MRSQLQEGLINIADTGGGAVRNKRRNPVSIGIAQCAGAEGMDVNGDRTCDKTKVWLRKGPRRPAGVPSIIKSAIGHGVAIGKHVRCVLVNHRNADTIKLLPNFIQPSISDLGSGCSVM